LGGGTCKHCDTYIAKTSWVVNTRRYTTQAGPASSKLPHPVEGDTVPLVHVNNMLGKPVWVSPATAKGKPIHEIAFAQGSGCIWWVMWNDGVVQCVPHVNLILDENSR